MALTVGVRARATRWSWAIRTEAGPTLAVGGLAAATGYVLVAQPGLVRFLLLVPLALWLFVNRFAAALLMAATMPYAVDISGGALGVSVAASDVLLSFFVAALMIEWLVLRRAPELRALAPLVMPVGQYVAVVAVLAVAHLGLSDFFQSLQRIELFVFPLVVGAALALRGQEYWVLRAYIVGASVIAALWIANIRFDQKNPAGQFMANGLLLLLASKELRRGGLILLMPLLAAGTLWSQSRGAIVSVGVGLVVLALTGSGANRARAILLTVPLAIASYVAFRLLPEDAQERNLTFTSGNETAGEWAIKIREQYHADAWEIIHANPWVGVGIGNYRAGNPYQGTYTVDPHQVLLLQAAEGGYLLAGSFVVLVGLALLVVSRVARRAPLVGAGVAVSAAIVMHGFVDTYWVRGTPVLGWLALGMALGQTLRLREAPDHQQAPAPVLEPTR